MSSVLKAPDPDPRVERMCRGTVVLRRDGNLAGHLLSNVSTFWSPSHPLRRQRWIWFLVVWSNGDRERPFEDYPPHWHTLREIDDGRFTWTEGRSEPRDFHAEVLDLEASIGVWQALGITDEDF